ncbi:LuxR C-terminal-related transcriptional regulator [Streptomyces sp. NBC_01077]|uniref:LuxR C-terminal-related transcriptional regulator n=1 Tax=Streptomyces sp. NBC_01077 TaxID=2903746 RepID=UPI003869B227|nr:LuxR C-terminal-related transcriptional regulator [Streptomyces sp. NBC_01077]WSV43444.1 LuxR C-terminal-related transcriptional regulator [Streptomyces sp. NBC_01077]
MGTQRQQWSTWPLAGREGQLQEITAAWADRHCRGVVICGPAGVGKSRLAEECLARAVRDGWKGRRATATAAAAAVPLGAIAHLIPPGVDLSDPVKAFATVATALAGPGRNRRRALWVDDLHLLDATSAVLLRQLIDAGVVRLIATVRTGEPLGETIDALIGGDAVYRVDLTPFDRQQTETVLRAALQGPLGRRALHDLHTASGGNVLYLHELAQGALQSGALVSDGEIWEMAEDRPTGTPKLAELIRTRLAAADSAARPVLELLAFTEALPLADAEHAAQPEALEALEQTELIRIVIDRRRTTLRLAHPLYGEELRNSIPVLRRQKLLLDQVGRTQAYGARRRDDALRIATWQLAATGTGDPALLLRAATLARHARDYPQALALLRAIPEEHYTTATRLILAEVLFQLGYWDRAETLLCEVGRSATDERERIATILGRTRNMVWGNFPPGQALAVIQDAEANAGNATGRHILRSAEGFIRIMASQPREGLTLLEDLEADISMAPDDGAWLRGAFSKTTALAMLGHTHEAIAWAERAYAANMHVDEGALVSHAAVQRIPLILALSDNGSLAEATRIGEYADTATSRISPLAAIWLALLTARAQWLAGHPASARYWYANAAARARAIDHKMALRPSFSGLAACAAVLGDQHAAEAALKERDHSPRLAMGFQPPGEEDLGQAWVYATRGHHAQARSVLIQAAKAAQATDCVTSEALLLTDAARLGAAADVQDRLSELAAQCDGTLAPSRAHLAAALAANNPERLETAAAELETIGADLLAAEAATQAAAAWQRAAQARKAAAATQRAQALAARCQGARTPLLTTAHTAAALTNREKEIALLAAGGTASKDIAAILHLSVRTVDNHLQHAYAKLGVTTRRELADTLGTPTTHPRDPTVAGR